MLVDGLSSSTDQWTTFTACPIKPIRVYLIPRSWPDTVPTWLTSDAARIDAKRDYGGEWHNPDQVHTDVVCAALPTAMKHCRKPVISRYSQ